MAIKNPITTEKAIRIVEAENKIVVVVDLRDNAEKIKKQFEKQFNAKVIKVNTLRRGNRKIAYIKLSPETPAIDIATRLGLI